MTTVVKKLCMKAHSQYKSAIVNQNYPATCRARYLPAWLELALQNFYVAASVRVLMTAFNQIWLTSGVLEHPAWITGIF